MLNKLQSSSAASFAAPAKGGAKAADPKTSRPAQQAGEAFGQEMAAAQVAVSSAAVPAPVPAPDPKLSQAPSGAPVAVSKSDARDSSALAGSDDKLLKSNQQQQQGDRLSSLNTAFANAGPKNPVLGSPVAGNPWSKDWVFQGESALEKPVTLQPQAKAMAQQGKGSIANGEQQVSPERIVAQLQPNQEQQLQYQVVQQAQASQQTQQAQPLQRQQELPSAYGATAELESLSLDEPPESPAEGVADKGGAKGAKGTKARAEHGGQAALSGADFLSALGGAVKSKSALKAIDGGKSQQGLASNPLDRPKVVDPSFKRELGDLEPLSILPGSISGANIAQAQSQSQPNTQQWMGAGLATQQLTGHVVKGSMAQDRLSSESLLGISSSVQGLKASGGGEMRVRLRPDNLGELHLKVQTRGGDVRLQIQASDEGAKKILEESLTHLKDSLATQNLNLSRVEVSVGIPAAHDAQSSGSFDPQQHQQQRGGEFNPFAQQGFQSGSGSQGSSRWSTDESESGLQSLGGRSQASLSGAYGTNRAVSEGRLDVTA